MKTTEKVTRVLLSARKAAEALGISERKLWSLTASGEIPAVRIGRCKRYRVETLIEYARSREEGS